MSGFSGGCRCGAVRYSSSADALITAHCHCRDCQYASGAAYSTVAIVPTSALSIHGATSAFTVDVESGNQVTRRFCPTCGSPLFSELSANPDVMVVKAGSLDDPTRVRPGMHVWMDSAQPWAETSGSLPTFPRNPG